MKRLRTLAPALALLPVFALLGGCNLVVLDPSGDVAARQRDLLIESTGLMLLIIVPVILGLFPGAGCGAQRRYAATVP